MPSPKERPNRRREPRIRVDAQAEVTLLGDEPAAAFPGTIADISSQGLRLVVDRVLPSDSAVRVSFDKHQLLGEVRYCLPNGSVFWVGVQLRETLTSAEEFLEWLHSKKASRAEGPASPVKGSASHGGAATSLASSIRSGKQPRGGATKALP